VLTKDEARRIAVKTWRDYRSCWGGGRATAETLLANPTIVGCATDEGALPMTEKLPLITKVRINPGDQLRHRR